MQQNIFPIPRPDESQELIREAGLKVAKRMSGFSEKEQSDLADAIANHYDMASDGYSLAKAIDDSYEYHFDIDMEFCQAMDEVSTEVDELVTIAEKAWVEENNIQPQFAVGTELINGTITGIHSSNTAKYLVKKPGHCDERDGISRLLVNFEDAKTKQAS